MQHGSTVRDDGTRYIGSCARCGWDICFPPWPAIVIKKDKPNAIICRECVRPEKVIGTSAVIAVVPYFSDSGGRPFKPKLSLIESPQPIRPTAISIQRTSRAKRS